MNKKSWYFLAVAMLFLIGFFIGIRRSDVGHERLAPPVTEQKAAALNQVGQVVFPVPTPAGNQALNPGREKLSDIARSRHGYYSSLLPASATGRNLAQMIALFPLRATNGPEAEEFKRAVEEAKRSPGAFESLSQLLDKLDVAHYDERQFIIQFAADLTPSPVARERFLAEEARRGPPGAADVKQVFGNAIALRKLMEVSSAEVAEGALRDAVSKWKDPAARALLIDAFSSKYPERGEAIAREVRE